MFVMSLLDKRWLLIINGLGFTGQTLYLFPEFFEDKPIDRLIGEGIQPEHLNDKVLGREKTEPCISKPEKEALSEPNCEMGVFLFSGDKCINGQ